jgi:glycosyltransferase involved in cell wall biosynthesis
MKIHHLLKIYNCIDAFITPSEFLRDKLIANGFDENKIHCIPTFTADSCNAETPIIGEYGLYFGRITEEKGVETLVHAYEKLPEKYRLVITGDDTTDQAASMKTYIREKNIKNIEFTGFRSGAELEQIIMKARFTFIPSIWYDNLPNTALESFQYSKPVLASNIGSLPELVVNGFNGYLFQPGNVDEVVNLVKKMDDDKLIETLGYHSHVMLVHRFSPEMHYKELMDMFTGLIPTC